MLNTQILYVMDGVGGMAVGVFIAVVSCVVLRETTLVLLDAYHDPQLVEEIRGIVESKGVEVKDVLLRASGPYVQSEIHIEAESDMTVGQLDEIKSSIENAVKERFIGIRRVVVSARARQR